GPPGARAALRLPARRRGGARAWGSAPPDRAGVRAARPLPPGEVRRARAPRRPGRVLPSGRARAGDARAGRPRPRAGRGLARADRDYVLADMNGSAVFLLAALKIR